MNAIIALVRRGGSRSRVWPSSQATSMRSGRQSRSLRTRQPVRRSGAPFRVAVLAGALAFSAAAAAEFKAVKLDSVHSRVGFTASTLLFDVHGRFNQYTLQLDGDPAQPAQAKVLLTIEAASIDTRNQTRDKHLSSPDFFHVEKYPKITFRSSNIAQAGTGLQVRGTLEMHGVRKALTIPLEVTKGTSAAGVDTTSFRGKLTLDRNDFGIGSANIAAKISLKDEVILDLQLVTFL